MTKTRLFSCAVAAGMAIVGLFIIAIPSSDYSISTTTAYGDVFLNTVAVITDSGHGSGWVSAEGVIVTCAHVIADAQYILIKSEQGYFFSDVIAADFEHDVALLNLPVEKRHLFSGLELNIYPVVGEPIWVCGTPLTLELFNTFTGGLLADIVDCPLGDDILFIDVHIAPGNSGSPVVDADGRVIGMAAAKLRWLDLGIAWPAQRIQILLHYAIF